MKFHGREGGGRSRSPSGSSQRKSVEKDKREESGVQPDIKGSPSPSASSGREAGDGEDPPSATTSRNNRDIGEPDLMKQLAESDAATSRATPSSTAFYDSLKTKAERATCAELVR